MRRFGRFPEGLGSLISSSLKHLDLETKLKEQTCILIWDEVVGEQVAGAAQPEYVRDGRMFVTTKSPVWANELTFYKADIIARLNKRVGADVVRDIVLKTGRVRRREVHSSVAESREPDLEGIELTSAELDKVESAVRAAGEQAGDSLRSLLTTAIRLEKWKQSQGWKPCKICGSLQNSPSGICPPCEIERGKSR